MVEGTGRFLSRIGAHTHTRRLILDLEAGW